MPIDFNALRPQVETIAQNLKKAQDNIDAALRSHKSQWGYSTPCYHCKEPIPPTDYRITDDIGNDWCTFCWGDTQADMETDNGT